jgi:pimeloyl-ACP methyl ester carboxylesterase
MDIVPTLEQWRAFADPAASTAYFHWPFLATPFAPDLIKAMGGAKFCRTVMERGRGTNESGIKNLEADDAYAHYCAQFDRSETIRGSCADYADGSVPECEAQTKEQNEGKKVRVPLLVLYSEGSLAKMHDVEACWNRWVNGELECFGIGDGHGHYFPESAPEIVSEQVLRWLKKVQE